MATTARTIATAMVKYIEAHGQLPQRRAVQLIQDQFGEEFLDENKNGNLAIDEEVLAEFRAFMEGRVDWDNFIWHIRKPSDHAGRSQTG